MKRQILGSVLSLSLCLAAGTAAPSGAAVQQDRQDRQHRDGLCRRAAALPQLPPEQNGAAPAAELRAACRVPGLDGAEPMSSPPAPPPEAMADAMAEGDSAIAVTGSRARRPSLESATSITVGGEDLAAESPASPPRSDGRIGYGSRRPAPARSGMLTAGDHDDLLNPELYADYVGKFLAGPADRRGVPLRRHRAGC